jgi:hypothetical protein
LKEDTNSPRKERKFYKDTLEKRIIAFDRRRRELHNEIRNLPLIKLEEPHQRGYKRFFVLRLDIAQGVSAPMFEKILAIINTTQYHYDDKFQTKRKRKRKRVYVDKPQELKNLSEYDWNKNPKISLSDKEKEYFELRDVFSKYTRKTQKEYVFAQPWRFVLRVEPNMITHVRQIDIELERELKFINTYIEQRSFQGKINKMYGRKKTYKAYTKSWDLSPRVKREHYHMKTMKEE